MTAETALLSLLVIPGGPAHVREARRFVERAVGPQAGRADAAGLLASELVTNSLLHSASSRPGGTVTIAVLPVPGGIRVEVTDQGGPTVPALREPDDPAAENGRGLRLVDTLSARWGCQPGDGQLITWFEMEVPAHD
jgi:anti-sigma regulatory factor (Ser/Thr protein kinase)